MFFRSLIDAVPPAHSVKKEYQQRMGLLRLFDQVDHIRGGLPVDGITIDIIQVDLTGLQPGVQLDFVEGSLVELQAMLLDGEYRQAFIQAEHPELQFGTAPFPVADDKTDAYGAGYITGNVMGIGKGSKNRLSRGCP